MSPESTFLVSFCILLVQTHKRNAKVFCFALTLQSCFSGIRKHQCTIGTKTTPKQQESPRTDHFPKQRQLSMFFFIYLRNYFITNYWTKIMHYLKICFWYLFMCICIVGMWGAPMCGHIEARGGPKSHGSVSRYVGAGNWTSVLCGSSKCYLPLSHYLQTLKHTRFQRSLLPTCYLKGWANENVFDSLAQRASTSISFGYCDLV